jgi:hypothetical protein
LTQARELGTIERKCSIRIQTPEDNEMTNEALMSLQHSESVVAQMAATIFTGLVQKRAVAGLVKTVA